MYVNVALWRCFHLSAVDGSDVNLGELRVAEWTRRSYYVVKILTRLGLFIDVIEQHKSWLCNDQQLIVSKVEKI